MKNAIIIAIVLIAVGLFVGNMLTYDSNNEYAQQCKSAGGEMAAWVTPIGVFEYCSEVFTGLYFLGTPCCGTCCN